MSCTVLITGANGFIGSHTSRSIEALGHRIVPIDVVPRSPDLSLLGIRTPSHIMNVTDAGAFLALCEKGRPTHVFHAAHPPRNEDPSVINYCYHAIQALLRSMANSRNRTGNWSKKKMPCPPIPLIFTAPRKPYQNGWATSTKRNMASISSPLDIRRFTARAYIEASHWN
ncbi:MAG: NAD-dependent epimerase/dehydratase family protein [Deltaproteobacteria bacterium]|nr:MAG: NAD-dependent epimerase/dehydratase family protein [Deltaproteobacteria bacterium]